MYTHTKGRDAWRSITPTAFQTVSSGRIHRAPTSESRQILGSGGQPRNMILCRDQKSPKALKSPATRYQATDLMNITTMSDCGLSSQHQTHGAAPRGHIGKLNEPSSAAKTSGGFLQPSITYAGTAREQQKKAYLLQKLIKDQGVMKQKLNKDR